MKRFFTLCLAAALLASAAPLAAQRNVYGFSPEGLDGQPVSLSQYRGKVLLVVNSATQCGFTPQYEALEALRSRLSSRGFEVLDFPCDQFGHQAPGSNAEIHAFCTQAYDISFPQFAKIDVNGEHQEPLFAFLKKKKPFRGFNLDDPTGRMMDAMLRKRDPNYDQTPDIKWNFTKFLINRKGIVVRRFEPTEPIDVIAACVEALL